MANPNTSNPSNNYRDITLKTANVIIIVALQEKSRDHQG